MLYIAHRGNTHGPDIHLENSPTAIDSAIRNKFDVEVDVRVINGAYYLGHDRATYWVNRSFLDRKEIWIHAKDVVTYWDVLSNFVNPKVFMNEIDDLAVAIDLKSREPYFWTIKPNAPLNDKSIAVMPERFGGKAWENQELKKSMSICTDYIYLFKDTLHV